MPEVLAAEVLAWLVPMLLVLFGQFGQAGRTCRGGVVEEVVETRATMNRGFKRV